MDDIVSTIEESRHHSVFVGETQCQQIIDDVKILPPKMIFSDAYDGKIFNQSLRIMNCGKYPAFVRVMAPSSKAFKIRPVPKGVLLPSGLSLIRKVLYTHTAAMSLPQACLYIYINEKPVFYEIEVHLISCYVSLKPRTVFFGAVDVGSASKAVPVVLKNRGHKIAYFAVDLGRHDLGLIVEPMKGSIQPNRSVEIRVEVLGSYLGSFNKEFWIKTQPPQQVNICGTFIPSRLVLDHPFTTFSIVMMEFPRTYFGAESVKALVIHNSSSTNAMFCTVAEYGKNFDYLDTVRATSNDLKCFFIKPKEGRLASQQRHTLRYSFVPKKILKFDKDFCIAFVKVIKVHYRDGVIVEKDVAVKTFPSITDLGKCSVESLIPAGEYDLNNTFESNFVRICLYGEMENASVELTPEFIYLNSLKLNQIYNQTVCIKNNSVNLPIEIKYIKVACVEIVPSEALLGPSGTVEVTVSIKPSKIGQTCQKVVFDLIYHSTENHYKVGKGYLSIRYAVSITPPKYEPKFNMGITPMLTNEVGCFVKDVRFKNNIDMPRQAIVDKDLPCFNKNNNALIAFPNDRPKSLRPWKNTDPSRTIFANLPRIVVEEDEYTLTAKEVRMKEMTRNVYATYIQSLAKATKPLSRNTIPEYTDDEKHLLLNAESFKEPSTQISNSKKFNMYMPLPPEQLMGVVVTPKHIQLGMIAPYTSCTEYFTIQNKNEYYIDVSIKALNNSVVIKEQKEMRIAPRQIKNILFDCFSNGLGEYYVPVFIIINKYHIFDATVFANVIPTTVTCPYQKIIIDPTTNESFFQIFNPVNCDISFTFEVQDKNFRVIPSFGTISPRKSVYCTILFLPQTNAIVKTEIYLISQSGAKQIITVVVENRKAFVAFNTDLLIFENIPLNTPVCREVVLRNFSDIKIMYMVSNSNNFEEITVKPKMGKLSPKSDIHFQITAHFKHVVDFNCFIEFLVQDVYTHIINITGNVVYPKIKLEPKYIQIPKIVSGSSIRRVFRITNMSEAESFISFPMQNYSEFTITDMDNVAITKFITLEPNEGRELYMNFNPPEPIAYSIYLPYIINGIIGPPALNDTQSTMPSSYFECTDLKFKSTVLPDILPTISVRCAAGARWLKFSSLHLHLCFTDSRIGHFTITNISSTDQEVTIPTIDPKYPFNIELENANNNKSTETSYKVLIELEEAVTFKVEFNPLDYGHYEIKIPIFVTKFFEKCPFNFLNLSGSHPVPSIVCKEANLCFQTIMVKEKICEKISLELWHHENYCSVIAKVIKADSITVKFLESTAVTQHLVNISFLLSFDPREECFVDCEVLFVCTCSFEASCSVFIKASADDSTLASYSSLFSRIAASTSVVTKSTYPYFPKSTDNSFYACKMRAIQRNIESWLYSQGFFFKNFYKIPYGLAVFPVEIKLGKAKSKYVPSKQAPPPLPLVQLLFNLLDERTMMKIMKVDKEPSTFGGIEETLYVYTIYWNITNFLKTQLIFVPQLKPEYLLPYSKYILFKNTFKDDSEHEEKIFTEEEFYAFSKQCWIDLIMRIYKVFVLKRTVTLHIPRARSRLPQSPVIYQEEFMKYCSEHICDFTDRCNNEAKLLLWLEFHFEKQKTVLWDSQDIKEPRKIRNFYDNLWDSLPFATLLVSYCPYMLNDLKNFYLDRQTDEQIFHNACVICIAWKKLQLSYDIGPNAIVNPLVLEMVLLTTYLYDVLPSLYPTETITFQASLGSTASRKVNLTNQSDVAISYRAIFFRNETDAFQVDSKTIVILPRKEKKLKITFLAKSVLKRTAVLVLSGETPGYKFCKSMAITLIGIPQIFNFSEEYEITIDTYQKLKKRLVVSSPYEQAYETDVYLYLGDQSDIRDDFKDFVSLSSISEMNVPRPITMVSMSSFDEDGDVTFHVTLCYVTVGVFYYYIFFINEEIGDFCIKLTINSVLQVEKVVELEVHAPIYFNPTLDCICNFCTCIKGVMNLNCPQVVAIKIPGRNRQLYDGLRLMLETCCGEDDFAFWGPLIEATKGIRVLKMYMENTFDEKFIGFKKILSQTVTYILQENPNYTTFKNFTIPNVFTDKTYDLPVHWVARKIPEVGDLVLIADHGEEKRLYKLIFKKPDQKLTMSVESITPERNKDNAIRYNKTPTADNRNVIINL